MLLHHLQRQGVRPLVRNLPHYSSRNIPRTTSKKWLRRFTYSAAGLVGIYAADRTLNASSVARNTRTFWTCAMITLDYKLNFTPDRSDRIPELHERVADRMFNLFTSNGGLYIKIGQSIGASAAMLPKPLQMKFAKLFDDAPQIPYSVVHSVLFQELGRPPSGPDGIFEIFEEEAVASASIAQVHRAKMWPRLDENGQPEKQERWVAVKVQKPDVSKQMEWDLGAYRVVMWLFENVAFDLPVYFVVDFVSDHLRQELDFVNEAKNACRTAEFVAQEPQLRDKVYIPKVYPEYSTKRVMTAEWIEGVRMSDKEGVYRLLGETPPLGFSSAVDPSSATALVSSSTAVIAPVNPVTLVKPLKGGVASVMRTMVELFSAQMFSWGWVHCDPHPGNIIVRANPLNPRYPQLVLLDHGLYVEADQKFRAEWANLWRAVLEGNYASVERVVRGWGLGVPDLMASFTVMKPTILKNGRKKKKGLTPEEEQHQEEAKKSLTHYELSVKMKEKLREFLADTDRMPKALLFLSKNMRMVQGNNQSFGSPVNRIKITGYWASKSQMYNPLLTFPQQLKELYHHIVFRTVMFSLDLAFYRSRAHTWAWTWVWRLRGALGFTAEKEALAGSGGFEEELERQLRVITKDGFGLEMGQAAFDG
ncbi:ABC1 family-domain-containing protein [Crepidotus variabilis]|uniref:ABC1 family-domain-containing protein n=1 Tax=Crepidotus variabilis TaxID=179855 RepID=A0A9P6EJL7_9AGAR|nr:ABC1 family-domain-containing protein [Crepidotus variabilis]